MDKHLQHKIFPAQNKLIPVEFIAVCIASFIISFIATAYFCISMGNGMKMTGGWSMSMMWMRMSGETWLTSGFSFSLMWLAMMVVMMMPSALPMFIKIKRSGGALIYIMAGYFFVWLLAGAGTYVLAIQLANAAMQFQKLSNAVPLLFGLLLFAVGIFQFTYLKITSLLHCRSPFGCAITLLQHQKNFSIGCKQGVVCLICCSGLMVTQVILGVMNPLIMIIVAAAITAEKLLPKPEIIVRLIGIVAVIAGFTNIIHWLIINHS